MTRRTDRNGRVIGFGYDELGRMTSEKWYTGATPTPTISIATTTEGGPISEVQRVGFTADMLGGGTFTLSFDGQTTSAISYNASADTVRAALEALSNIGVGDVAVTKLQDTMSAQEWKLTFTGALAGSNVAQTTVDSSQVQTMMNPPTNIQATDTQGATNSEVQTVTLSSASGGTFRLAYKGETSAPILHDATAATVESALEALHAVDQVTVTGAAGGPWTITFAGTHTGLDVPRMDGDAARLTSGTQVRSIGYAYDAASQLTSASDPDSAYAYTYDNLGRVTKVDNSGTPNTPRVELSASYDAHGNRTSLAAKLAGTDDFKTSYTFDALHRMTRVEQTGQSGGNEVAEKRIDLAYNAAGLFTEIVRYKDTDGGSANEVATAGYTYDGLGRLTGLAYKKGGNNLFTPYAWTYDRMNRVTQMSGQDGTSDYTYDATSQLTATDHSYQTDESYSYDANGNRTMTGYSTGTNNRLTSDGTHSYEYDDEGNRTVRTRTSTGEKTEYTWDHRNRLTRVVEKNSSGSIVKDTSYTYDVYNRRLTKSIDADGAGPGSASVQRFVYYGHHIVLELDGNTASDLTHRYLHGPVIDQILADESVSSLTQAGTMRWPLADNLGTVRDIVDSSASVLNHLKYDAYGKVTSETSAAVDFLFAFTGREREEESGQQFNRARYYDPAVGRWISEDPIGFAAGDANLVRYVDSNPVNDIDPSGLVSNNYGKDDGSGGWLSYQAWLWGENYWNHPFQGMSYQFWMWVHYSHSWTPPESWSPRTEKDFTDKWGDYFKPASDWLREEYFPGVGQVLLGYGDAAKNLATGLYSLVTTNPLTTASAILNAAMDLPGTANAIADWIKEKLETPRGQGELVGDVLLGMLGGGFLKAAKESATAAKFTSALANKLDNVASSMMRGNPELGRLIREVDGMAVSASEKVRLLSEGAAKIDGITFDRVDRVADAPGAKGIFKGKPIGSGPMKGQSPVLAVLEDGRIVIGFDKPHPFGKPYNVIDLNDLR